MPLNSQAKRLLDMLAVAHPVDVAQLTPAKLRDDMLRLARLVGVRNVMVAAVEDRSIAAPQGPMRIRVYSPRLPPGASSDRHPGLLYFHGGMGVSGSLESYDGLCRTLANESGCRVISVDYRLAPEHPFPSAVDDAWFAGQWVAQHAEELGLDRDRIAIGGDSAGGTLAAVFCQLAREHGGPQFRLQLLLCPVTDLRARSASHRHYGSGYSVDPGVFDWARTLYCGPEADLTDPRISPLLAADLTNLPPALIHTAEFDPMHDEGEAYARALERSGVTVRYSCHEGMIHNFYCMAGVIAQGKAAIAAVGAELRGALAA